MRATAITHGLFLAVVLHLIPLSASATNIVSRPVGIMRIAVEPASRQLVSLPFQPFDASINAILRDHLTGSSEEMACDRVLRWNAEEQVYVAARRTADGEPCWVQEDGTPSDMTFEPGEAFWIENRQAETQTVHLAGCVVLDEWREVILGPALNLFSYPFSSKIALNETTLAEDGGRGGKDMPEADAITETRRQRRYRLLDDLASEHHGKWLDEDNALSNEELTLGRGYWYDRLADESFTWHEPRPYGNAFPPAGARPCVTAMTCEAESGTVTLWIAAEGSAGEMLEIYYRDLRPMSALDTESGWIVAAIGIGTTGRTEVAWTDTGAESRAPIDATFARFFLVARGDIDSDGDGVPDARERFVAGTDPSAHGARLAEVPAVLDEEQEGDSVLFGALDAFDDGETDSLQTEMSNRVPPEVFTPGHTIYVDQQMGNDLYSGRAAALVAGHGPKKTIRAGLEAAQADDTLAIMTGNYGEDLNVAGRSITVRIVGSVNLPGRRGDTPFPTSPDGEAENFLLGSDPWAETRRGER